MELIFQHSFCARAHARLNTRNRAQRRALSETKRARSTRRQNGKHYKTFTTLVLETYTHMHTNTLHTLRRTPTTHKCAPRRQWQRRLHTLHAPNNRTLCSLAPFAFAGPRARATMQRDAMANNPFRCHTNAHMRSPHTAHSHLDADDRDESNVVGDAGDTSQRGGGSPHSRHICISK